MRTMILGASLLAATGWVAAYSPPAAAQAVCRFGQPGCVVGGLDMSPRGDIGRTRSGAGGRGVVVGVTGSRGGMARSGVDGLGSGLGSPGSSVGVTGPSVGMARSGMDGLGGGLGSPGSSVGVAGPSVGTTGPGVGITPQGRPRRAARMDGLR
jgi:hypothetical protein